MDHLALARRYRPRRFADVVGQRHVADTLRSAVARGRVGHAYLFCGPRGTGKTTLARVLAMALNCPQRTAEGEPCGVCDSCERIWAGRASLDVVEIDAASNRGVDDARELRERAQYAPSDEGRHKVYIVDEAHMLTREAWNALLKILEEPPPRVHFVFATTEPQRIQQSAPPILSRCQRFDFRRIAERELVTRLQEILSAEGVAAEEEALRLLARRADGGLRDALSALDQVLAFAVPPITVDAVRSALGWVDEEWYCALLEAIADRDAVATLRLLGRAQDEGMDWVEFYRGWLEALRSLLARRLGEDAPPARADLEARWRALTDRFVVGDLLRLLHQSVALDVDGQLRRSAQPRVLLEILFVGAAFLDRTVELADVLAALGGPPPPASPDPRPAETPAAVDPTDAPLGAAPAEAAPRPVASSTPRRPAVSAVPDWWADALAEAGLGDAPWTRHLRVRHDGPRVVVELPPGWPLRPELAATASARRALERALRARLGAEVRLEVETTTTQPRPADVDPRAQRRRQLAARAQQEPLLARAVEEWELEPTEE